MLSVDLAMTTKLWLMEGANSQFANQDKSLLLKEVAKLANPTLSQTINFSNALEDNVLLEIKNFLETEHVQKYDVKAMKSWLKLLMVEIHIASHVTIISLLLQVFAEDQHVLAVHNLT